MTATYNIKVKELNPKFIQGLQERYPEGEVEVKVRPPRRAAARMDEEMFWSIIGLLDWKKGDDDQAVAEPAVRKLASLPVPFIFGFQDLLAEKLHALDGEAYAAQIGEDAYAPGKFFSVDNFLYARCCVVANGKEAYGQVLENPVLMPKDLTFEALLSIAPKAFRRKTGEQLDYLPAHNYETFSNEEELAVKQPLSNLLPP